MDTGRRIVRTKIIRIIMEGEVFEVVQAEVAI